jgi:hypothetical protein
MILTTLKAKENKMNLACEACRGCKSLLVWNRPGVLIEGKIIQPWSVPDLISPDIMKCSYIYSRKGLDAIPNCPCQTCLIKTVCYSGCDEFADLKGQMDLLMS